MAELSCGVDRLEDARHDLASPRPMCVIHQAVFKKLRVDQDDAQLVIELMKQAGEIGS